MTTPAAPSDTARETLIQLARRRLAPTPENYTAMYHELSGSRAADLHPAAGVLREFASTLVGCGGESARTGRLVERAVGREDWGSAQAHLVTFAQARPVPQWARLVQEILKGLDARHPGITLARKREALDRVLSANQEDDARANSLLTSLTRSWGTVSTVPRDAAAAPARIEAVPSPSGDGAQSLEIWKELLAGTLEFMMEPAEEGSEVAAASVSQRIRETKDESGAKEIIQAVRTLWLRWELQGSEREEIQRGLQSLLRLMVENARDLVEDDQWLRGQTESIMQLLAAPVTRKRLRETERGLRAVLYKQSARKYSLDQAKRALKEMVGSFVVSLEELGREAGIYHERIGDHRRRIEETNDMADLRSAVGDLLADTRTLQADVLRRRDVLETRRLEATGHERRIRELETQLVALSETARQDPLTGLLNRRGFEGAFDVESSRAERTGSGITLALLDVDNFKRLNDSLGHAAGDLALEHLADVIRETLRPTDVVARYGGEEFVIVLPATPEAEAAAVIERVQRTLTRRFFLANNEKVFITFSAGVAERVEGEERDALVDRADRALYEAKRAGKNRVSRASGAGTA